MKSLIKVLLMLALTFSLTSATSGSYLFYSIDIANLGSHRLDTVKNNPAIKMWIEAGRNLIVYATPAITKSIKNLNVTLLKQQPPLSNLAIVYGHHHDPKVKASTLFKAGRARVVVFKNPLKTPKKTQHMKILPLTKNTVLARLQHNNGKVEHPEFKATTNSILENLNAERWLADVEYLASFNRYTKGDEINTVRDWLVEQFEALGLATTTQEFPVSGSKGYNVVATLTGSERPDEVYIIGAHYDAISENPRIAAPGAEDNATGTAALLELARAFTKIPPKATLIFIAFSGEEQGLYGSTAYVKDLIAAGNETKVKGVITMDMIGYDKNQNLDCLLETVSDFAVIADHLAAVAGNYTKLEILRSYNAWGSDHMPFIDKGMPAILTIENDYEDYDDYHRTTDTIENISSEMGYEVIRLNTAAVAEWAY